MDDWKVEMMGLRMGWMKAVMMDRMWVVLKAGK